MDDIAFLKTRNLEVLADGTVKQTLASGATIVPHEYTEHHGIQSQQYDYDANSASPIQADEREAINRVLAKIAIKNNVNK